MRLTALICREMLKYQDSSGSNFQYRLDQHRSTKDITFNDLPTIRAGRPYLLWHHGSCQHMLVIRSARIPEAEEGTSTPDGPLITYLSMGAINQPGITSQRLAGYNSYYGGRCGVCEIRYPRYLLYGGERARLQGNSEGLQGMPENLSMCNACFDVAVGRQEPADRSGDVLDQHDHSDSLPYGGSEWTTIPILDN
jgi:snRNA-activating protein complex (SNAPc), subunit 3